MTPLYCRTRRRMRKLKYLLVFALIGLAALWWSNSQLAVIVTVGQSLTLYADSRNVELRLISPDGGTRLRGTLGNGQIYVEETAKPCSVAGGRRVCAVDVKVPSNGGIRARLRLEVGLVSNATDCYTVSWRSVTGIKNVSVKDCFDLTGALWYGGPQVINQRWPINSQRSELQPHLVGDYLMHKWRSNKAYGKYGSLAEPYWVSSAGVGIVVVDDCFTLSSSFNARGDGRLCLKGSRLPRNDGRKVPTVLSYRICHRKDVAAVHRTMSDRFFKKPHDYPDARVLRQPIWSTWAQYKANVNQSIVENMADQILYYNFPHR